MLTVSKTLFPIGFQIFDCLCCYHYVHQECALSAQWINMTDVDVENSVLKQHIVTLDLKEKLFE